MAARKSIPPLIVVIWQLLSINLALRVRHSRRGASPLGLFAGNQQDRDASLSAFFIFRYW
jgi:hypothetical protein